MSHHWNDKTDVLTTNLCLLRKRYRLTQPQVAKAAHIDRSSYAYYELGKTHPRLNTLVSLLSFYGVSMDMILGVVPMAFPPAPSPSLPPDIPLAALRRRLAENMRYHRQRLNLRQSWMADYLSVARTTYSHYEAGRSTPSYRSLVMLGRLFGISTDCLLADMPVDENDVSPSPSYAGTETAKR